MCLGPRILQNCQMILFKLFFEEDKLLSQTIESRRGQCRKEIHTRSSHLRSSSKSMPVSRSPTINLAEAATIFRDWSSPILVWTFFLERMEQAFYLGQKNRDLGCSMELNEISTYSTTIKLVEIKVKGTNLEMQQTKPVNHTKSIDQQKWLKKLHRPQINKCMADHCMLDSQLGPRANWWTSRKSQTNDNKWVMASSTPLNKVIWAWKLVDNYRTWKRVWRLFKKRERTAWMRLNSTISAESLTGSRTTSERGHRQRRSNRLWLTSAGLQIRQRSTRRSLTSCKKTNRKLCCFLV